MKKLCTFLEVDILIHWTFWLLGIYPLTALISKGPEYALMMAGILVVVYGFVIMHEYGHILMGRYYGQWCGTIILTPLGGLATFNSKFDDNPKHELMITIGGPLTNAVVVIGIMVGSFLGSHKFTLMGVNNVVEWIACVNMLLFIFNMIPAYPMDGGRIFKSVLRLAGCPRAGYWTANVAKIFAGLMVGYGVYDFNLNLIIIGVIIFMVNHHGEHRYE